MTASCVDAHPSSPYRPLRDKAARLVGFDLVPFGQHPAPEFGVGVPQRPRDAETVDRDQHLLDLGPVALQRHGITPRRPCIAETDHAADVGEAELSLED